VRLGTVAVCAVLALAVPAAVLALFGAKSAVALMIGLALALSRFCRVPHRCYRGWWRSRSPSLLRSLRQRTACGNADSCRKVRYLAGIMSAIVVAAIAANRMGNNRAKDGEDNL
jgi:hypothetical protein